MCKTYKKKKAFVSCSLLLGLAACSSPTTTNSNDMTAAEDMARDASSMKDMKSSKDSSMMTEDMSSQDVVEDSGSGDDMGNGKPLAERVLASFGNIETIAGSGKIRDKGQNGWMSGFEGGPATSAELSRPHNAMEDGKGLVYIADKDAHAIRRIELDGTITTVAGTSVSGDDGDGPGDAKAMRLSAPNGLWVKSDGTVYIYDLGNDKVRKMTPEGRMSTLFKVGGSGTGRGLWVSEAEDLAYISAGSTLKRWRKGQGVDTLATGFTSLGNLHVSPKGKLAVTDRDGHRVWWVNEAGEKTLLAGNGTTSGARDGAKANDVGLNEVRGLWFHPEGGFFLATHKGGKVWFVDDALTMHLFLDGDKDHTHEGDGGSYDAPGKKISEPRAVTMTPGGDVLVTENDHGYIRRVLKR